MKIVLVSWAPPLLVLFSLLSAATVLRAQSSDQSLNRAAVPMVTDWSHHRLVFSRTDAHTHSSSPRDLRLQGDRRFQQQVARRNAVARTAAPLPEEWRHIPRPGPGEPQGPASEGSL